MGVSALASGAQLARGGAGTNLPQAEAVELCVPRSSSISLSGRLFVNRTLRPRQTC